MAVGAGAAVSLLLLLGLWKIIQSPTICRLSIRKIERAAKSLADVDLTIGNLRWGIFPPTLRLEDLRIQRPSFSLQVDRVRIGFGAFWISRRTLVLSSVDAEGLDLNLHNNSLQAKPGPREAPIRVLIQNLDLRGISFNGALIKTKLNIHGGELAWVRQGVERSGYLRMKSCRIERNHLEEIQASIQGSFVSGPQGLRIRRLSVNAPEVALVLKGRLSKEGFAGNLQGKLGLKELDRIIHTHGLLQGKLKLEAEINSGRDEFARVRIHSDEIRISHDFPLKNFDGRLDISIKELRGRILKAEFFGGKLRGDYHLGAFKMPFPHDFTASCEGMDLASFFRGIRVPPAGLSGRMKVEAEAKWNSDHFPDGRGRAQILFSPTVGQLPVKGLLKLELNGRAFLEFNAKRLEIAHSFVDLQGPLTLKNWKPAWSIHADPIYLGEVLPAVNDWVGSDIFPELIRGHGALDLSLDGPFSDPRVALRMDAEDLAYPPIHLDRADLEGVVSGGAFELEQGHFRLGEGGGSVRGAIRWRPTQGRDELELQIDGRDLPLEKIMKWAGLGASSPRGEVSITGGLRGDLHKPTGSWALSLSRMSLAQLNCGSGAASIELEQGVFHARQLEFDRGLKSDLFWDLPGRRLGADFQWKNMDLPPTSELRRFFGRSSIDCNGKFLWALDETLADGSIEFQNDRVRGKASIEDGHLLLESSVDESLEARLEIPHYEPETSWTGTGKVESMNVAALEKQLLGSASSGLSGKAAVLLNFEGRGPRLLSFSARPALFQLNFHNKALSLQRGGGLSWTPAGFDLQETELSRDQELIDFGGRTDSDGNLHAHLSGKLDARAFAFWLPEWEPAGTASGAIEILGPIGAPYFQGQAEVESTSFRLPGTHLILSDLRGKIRVSREGVALDGMEFRILRGRGRGSGLIRFSNGTPQFELSGKVHGLEYPLFDGLTPRLSGSWRLGGPAGDFTLGGDLSIDSAELRSKKDLPSLLLSWLDAPHNSSSGLSLDLHVKADQSLVSRSPLIRLSGNADLHILGDLSSPGIVGQISFEDGGELTIQGIRYEVDRAHLGFADPSSIDPMINLGLTARIQDYQVWVQINGSMDHLIPVVSSDPPLSPSEIYSLMSVGSLGSGAGPGGAIGLSVASSMLSNRLQDALESRDLWLLPIDQFRIDPFVENLTGDPSARVTVVKQLSPNLTVTLQSDLSAQKNQVITGRWYLGAGLFIEASRGRDRQVGVDFKLRRRY